MSELRYSPSPPRETGWYWCCVRGTSMMAALVGHEILHVQANREGTFGIYIDTGEFIPLTDPAFKHRLWAGPLEHPSNPEPW